MRTNYQSLTTFNLTEGHFKSNVSLGKQPLQNIDLFKKNDTTDNHDLKHTKFCPLATFHGKKPEEETFWRN